MEINKKIRIGAVMATALMAVGAYAIWDGVRFVKAVPEDFIRAREQSALISADIVNMAASISADLSSINDLDQKGKYEEAVKITEQAIERSKDVRSKVLDLSRELEAMTKMLPEIKSPEAREAAKEAISNRIALSFRLMDYSAYLANLLTSLQAKFRVGYTVTPVAPILEQINSEVTAINSFNKNASASMEKFDSLVSQYE